MIGGCILIETIEQCLYRLAGLRPKRWVRYVAPAVVLHVLGLMLWLNILSKRPLGEVLPLMGANFVTVALAGSVFFGERLAARRLAGIALVAIGFMLVGFSFQ
jgi:drug/metabolite transporter (DMT)-like permease